MIRRRPTGFTLIEIIIALAVIALLAGTIAPLAYREIQQAREEATLKELAAIQKGLREIFDDTGRFPSEAEGLAALVVDPGITGWSGPYLGGNQGDPTIEVNTDSFGETYHYDLAPGTDPAGAADVLVASSGLDRNLTAGRVGSTWTLDAEGDDLLTLVSAGALNRDKIRQSQDEMEAIGQAARQYYMDHASFPASLGNLTQNYMDLGFEGEAYVDAWNNPYTIVEDGAIPPSLTITSRGPDQSDDGGAGDDLALTVSSIPPGRTTTMLRLEIAQAALNNNPGTLLSGDWAVDLGSLGLPPAFANDGWGRRFQINISARTIYSTGPDGNHATLSDNLPAGVGS